MGRFCEFAVFSIRPMRSTTPAEPFDAETASCKGCGYALRQLPENRCPECGLAFDSGNPQTYAGGGARAEAYRRVRPGDAMSQRPHYVGLALVLWGEAWLPGGIIVTLTGAVLVALAFLVVSATHETGRMRAARRYGWTLVRPRHPWHPWVALALTAAAVWFALPLRAVFLLHRPFLDPYAHEEYEVRPFIAAHPPLEGWVGALYIVKSQVGAGGVTLTIFPGGHLTYAGRDGRPPPLTDERVIPLGGGWYATRMGG